MGNGDCHYDCRVSSLAVETHEEERVCDVFPRFLQHLLAADVAPTYLFRGLPPRDSFDWHNVYAVPNPLDNNHSPLLPVQANQAKSTIHLPLGCFHEHHDSPSCRCMDTRAIQQYVRRLLLAVFLCCCAGCYAEVSFATDSSRENSVPTPVSQLLQKQEDNFRASQRRSSRFVATIVAVLIALLLVSLAFILRLVLRQKDSELDQQKQSLFHKKSARGISVSHETMALQRRCAALEAPSEDEWQQFQKMIDRYCDGFSQRILSAYKLSTQELRVCLLIKSKFKPSEIAVLTVHSKEAITSTRRRLYKKMTGVDGTPEMLDELILNA